MRGKDAENGTGGGWKPHLSLRFEEIVMSRSGNPTGTPWRRTLSKCHSDCSDNSSSLFWNTLCPYAMYSRIDRSYYRYVSTRSFPSPYISFVLVRTPYRAILETDFGYCSLHTPYSAMHTADFGYWQTPEPPCTDIRQKLQRGAYTFCFSYIVLSGFIEKLNFQPYPRLLFRDRSSGCLALAEDSLFYDIVITP